MSLRRLTTVVGVLLGDARRHRLQTVTTLLGIAVGTAVVVAIHLASEAAQQSFARNMADFTGRATHQLRAAGPLPAGRLAELLAAPGVTAVQPVIETTLVTVPATRAPPPPGSTARAARRAGAEAPDAPRALRLVGLDPFFARPFLPEPPPARDAAPQSGELLTRLLTEPGLALAPQTLLDELELAEGDTLVVRGPHGPLALHLEALPDTLFGPLEGALVLADIATAAEWLALGEQVLRFDLVLTEGADPGDIPLRPGERLERAERRGERAESLTRAFRGNLLALAALALLVGAFLVFNMAQFAVTRRRPLLGKLRCLGCPARDLRTAVLAEACAMGLLGGVLGVAAGRLLAATLVGDVTATVSTLYGPAGTAQVSLDPWTALLAVLLSMAAAAAACLGPARDAAATPPVLLAGSARAERRARPGVLFALLAAGALALLPWPGPPLLTALVLPSLAVLIVLLAAARAVPALLAAVLRRLPRGPILALASDHLQRSLGRAGAAAGALTMPIAMTIAIAVMVASFRAEVSAWSQSMLRGDVYAAPAFQELAPFSARLPAGLAAALEAEPGVLALDARRVVTQAREDSEFLVVGARLEALAQHAELRVTSGDRAEAFAAAARGEALVSEPLARRLGLAPGAELTLHGLRGPQRVRVAAIFQDFALERGYALLGEAQHLALFGETGVANIALVLAPGTDGDALLARLAGDWPDAEFIAVGALRESVARAFDRTFAITFVLQGIATVLALVGVLTALLCLQLERRAELGVLRALGASAATLLRLVLAEAVLIAGVACIAALPVGLALAWILIAIVNTRSFGWSFPMLLPAGPVAEVLLPAFAAGLVAGLVPWLLVRRARIAALLESAQ